jgi:hypothetical protein
LEQKESGKQKFGTKRVEKEIKDNPPKGSSYRYEGANVLKGEDFKKKAAELELDEIIPPMRFRKKGGIVESSNNSNRKRKSPEGFKGIF